MTKSFRNFNKFVAIWIISFLVVGLTPKTPNFGWMAVYSPPNFPNLLTGIATFRPLLPLEQIEYSLFGTLFFTSQFLYSLIFAWCLYEIFHKSRVNPLFILTFSALLFLGFFASYAGNVADVIFALALIKITKFISSKQYGYGHSFHLALWIFILDMARPNALIFVFLFIAILLFINFKFGAITAGFSIALIAPFHINQFLSFKTVGLTTYQGMNLFEVFNPTTGATGLVDCNQTVGQFRIDSLEYSECSNLNQKILFESISADPTLLLTALRPSHLRDIILPDVLWHGVNPLSVSFEPFLRYLLQGLGVISIVLIALLFLISLRNLLHQKIVFAVVSIGLFTLIFGHGGHETIRLILPYILLISFSIFRSNENQDGVYLWRIEKLRLRSIKES